MKRCAGGFTLIEMLLALMLTSLLTAALSMMIGQAAREREAMRKQSHDPAWSVQLINLLERDLRQARWWAGADDRIVLIGLGRDGLPAQIEYRWGEHEASNTLTRKQVGLTDGVSERRPAGPEVIGLDLNGLRFGPFVFGDRLKGDAVPVSSLAIDRSLPTLLIDGRTVPLQRMPEQVLVQLLFDGSSKTSLSREVILR